MYRFLLLVLFALVMFASCGPTEEEQAQQQQREQQLQNQQTTSSLPYNFRLEMENLLDHYFDLKDAITSADTDAARDYSEQLAEATFDAPQDLLEPEDQGFWVGVARIIRTESENLVEEDTIEEQRIYFERISTAMIRMVDEFNPVQYTLYLMECDEAGIGDNQWLSREEEVLNPYQTNAGSGCGEIEERF
ncbi:MAG: DUF3347 domain-containing protein [Balneolaceae bacterium]